MAPKDPASAGDDPRDHNTPSGSGSTSETPLAGTNDAKQPFRSRANAPNSPYPPPSNHEYPPRTVAPATRPTSSRPKASSSSSSSGTPKDASFILPLVNVPPLATLRGRPTYPPRPPNQNDERCIIYCTQTASRRSVGQQPICKTWCWRRLFPQDYIPLDQLPENNAADATAAAGVPAANKNAAGEKDAGKVVVMPDGRTVIQRGSQETQPGIFGFDGRYVYFGRSRFRARDRLDSMSHTGLSEDWTVDEMVKPDDPRKDDKAYMEFLRRYHHSTQIELGPLPRQFASAVSEQFSALLAPATKYVESFAPGGAQEKFALKVWDKARQGDGWTLFSTSAQKLWDEAVKKSDDEKKNGKGGTGGTPTA